MAMMTYEEYMRLGNHTAPYLLRIEAHGKELYFFGEDHSYDPGHPQWSVLKSFWEEFLSKTAGKERIALTEGGVRPVLETEEASIKRFGGMGLVTFLASKAGIEVRSPEPNEREERAELEKRFSRDEIEYYYFARVVAQWYRYPSSRLGFEDYMDDYLKDDKTQSGWSDFDFSLENMKRLHEKFYGKPFDKSDKNHFSRESDPTLTETRINAVARAVSIYRDEHIVAEIRKYWDSSRSVFASYGHSHVVIQEPLLREVLR